VNAVMNLRVTQNWGISMLPEELLALSVDFGIFNFPIHSLYQYKCSYCDVRVY
jgi:hypothetical protein